MRSLFFGLFVAAALCVSVGASAAATDMNAAAKLGWKLGTQMYTFNQDTFIEALKKVQALGLKYIEIYPGQKFSAHQAFGVSHTMTPEQRAMVKKAVADAGVKMVSYGVVDAANDAEWEQIFAFGKDLGLEFIDCEPARASLPRLDKLTKKYGLNVAIHNHPKPSAPYWNPDILLDAVKTTHVSSRIKACGDTGHWMRSELNPVQCLRKLKDGRLGFMHFKDLNVAGPAGHDVAWGSGANDVWAEMSELRRQGWKGYVIIEYESWVPQRFEEIKQSIDSFKLIAAALDKDGWQPLFKRDLSNAQMQQGGWAWQRGALVSQKNGDIYTKEKFGDFILALDFKCAPDTNSGIFLRTADLNDWLNTAIEVQVLQKPEDNKTHNTGAIFDVKAPSRDLTGPVGQWNRCTIIARRNMIYVMLNGSQVNCINLDEWTKAGMNPDGTRNKFKYAYKDMGRSGFIGVQFHGMPIAFRNLRIKSLD